MYKRIISGLLTVAMAVMITPGRVAKANNLDKELVSKTILTADEAKVWAKSKNATDTFISLADLYWKYSSNNGNINPAIAYVQAAKETGYGHFGGVLDESYFNPCGMKNSGGGDDLDKNAHYRFNNWDEGVQAHLDHMALYAGASGYPRKTTYDPRHFATIFGTAKTILSLEGKWATSPNYGSSILGLYNEISKYVLRDKKMEIEVPNSNLETEQESIEIKGWAINPAGIKEVQIYVNNKFYKQAEIGLSRNDVGNQYPAYPGSNNSGYYGKVNLSGLPKGDIEIKVEAIGLDNSKQSKVIKIRTKDKISRMAIDTISNNVVFDKKVNVGGWALNHTGIREVKIYLNDKYLKNASIGISRNDVNEVYPGYINGENSGYFTTIEFENYGLQKILVEAVGNNGTSQLTELKIDYKKRDARINIDQPWNGSSINSDSLRVEGWALNATGMKEIRVYLDNQFKGNAKLGIERLDVDQVYPGYTNGKNSGYYFDINLKNVSAGNKIIKIEAEGNDGVVKTIESYIKIVKKEHIVSIDYPFNEFKALENSMNVSGWTLNQYGIKAVNLYIDDKFMGAANLGIERLDVDQVYPGYIGGKNSGYSINLDLTNVSEGNKILKVESIGNDGSKKTNLLSINVQKKISRMSIDTPYVGEVIKSKNILVSGWALNPTGVKAVEIYIDNKFIANADLGIKRLDVDDAYPGYKDGKTSGYSKEISIENIAGGERSLKVKVVGNNGSAQEIISKLIIDKKKPIISIESPYNFQKVSGNKLIVSGWALSVSGVKEIKIYLDGSYVGNGNIGFHRPDVNNTYPGYHNGEYSGYYTEIDISKLKNNNDNILEVVAIDNEGIQFKNSVVIKRNRLVVLDPGHNINSIYGIDSGARYTHDGVVYKEEVLNMQLTLKLKEKLLEKGFDVILTQEPGAILPDKTVSESLQRRAKIANTNNADLFISIHHNSATAAAKGTEVYYSTDRAVEASKEVIESSKKIADTLTTTIANAGGFYKRSSKNSNFYVTRNTKMASVLAEIAFISNKEDAKKAANQNVQLKVASEMANSIESWFQNK